MFRPVFILIFLFDVVCAQKSNGSDQKETLIHELDVKSFDSWTAKQHMHASVVLFHNSKSALSKIYFPTFVEASNQAANWTEFLKFYSFDCITNKEICHKFGFRSAPVVKYFSANTAASNFGQEIRAYFNGTDLLKEVVTKLNIDFANEKCPKCPNLRMYYNTAERNRYIFNVSKYHWFVPVESMDDPRGIDALLEKEKYIISSGRKQTTVWRALTEDLTRRYGNQTIFIKSMHWRVVFYG